MQSSTFRFNFTPFPKPQGEAVFQRPLRPPPYPGKGGMDIGGLLNARNAAAADAELRRQLQQSMQMDGGVPYGLSQAPAMGHHQASIQQPPNGMSFGVMGQPQHNPQLYAQGYLPRHGNQNPMADDNYGAMRPKAEAAPKAFACSTCQKGFARRSDLARHGKDNSPRRSAMPMTRTTDNVASQSAYTVASGLTHANTRDAGNSSFKDPP